MWVVELRRYIGIDFLIDVAVRVKSGKGMMG